MSQPGNTWRTLQSLAAKARTAKILDLLDDPARLGRYTLTLPGLYADFSKHLVSDTVLAALLDLAREAGVIEQAHRMHRGEPINITEKRAVMHMALRTGGDGTDAFAAGADAQRQRMQSMSDAVRSGSWKGHTGKAITDLINIGIGGSDLGPKMACTALREYHDGPRTHFISNVDGAEIRSLTSTLDADTTLIAICSKTFTTAETMLNARTALDWLGSELSLDSPAASSHCIGITGSPDRAMALGLPADQILTFDESIGGRYSLWSTPGFSICVALGFENYRRLLDGAALMDRHFLNTGPEKNLPLLLGMLGIWYNNFLGAQSHAVIPYCERLGLIVDYLQQMDMESNGKSATLGGEMVKDETGPVIWGQTGTNGQHAFFQLLHQGTKLVPVDFIGTVTDRLSESAHHRMLNANMIAQSQALMAGRASENPHRHYPGNRPSTVLLLDELSPARLGMLIALYEHRVFTQGVVWDINSFDQWGVELGKELAGGILEGDSQHDSSTAALIRKAGLDR